MCLFSCRIVRQNVFKNLPYPPSRNGALYTRTPSRCRGHQLTAPTCCMLSLKQLLRTSAENRVCACPHVESCDTMSSKTFRNLPPEMEHSVHEYLRVGEVCLLTRVAKSWHRRIGQALASTVWDVVHVEGVDVDVHTWLEHLADARVKIRSIQLVCLLQLFCSNLEVFRPRNAKTL